ANAGVDYGATAWVHHGSACAWDLRLTLLHLLTLVVGVAQWHGCMGASWVCMRGGFASYAPAFANAGGGCGTTAWVLGSAYTGFATYVPASSRHACR
ncbi:MAG: hypothetical protein RSC68_33990, partial [Acinetobacter sp.]